MEQNTHLYKIGQLTRACDISRSTLMRFEEDGLLQPAYVNDKSGYRYYDSNNLAQVFTILKFQKLGFTKKEIRAMSDASRFDEGIQRLQHQHMLILRELEDMISRKDKPDTLHIRTVETLGGNFFYRRKEIIYTPENIRSLAISTLEDFMDAHIAGNTHQTMKIFIDEPDWKGGEESIGQFDGKLHSCICIIPTMNAHKGPDFMTMEPCLALTMACNCNYNDSEDLFRMVWDEADVRGLEPDGPICIAGFPDFFFGSDPQMKDSTLRLILRTK